jgi:hypothetical protein
LSSAVPKKERKAGPKAISLYPLTFEEVIRDVLTMKPPAKAKKPKKKST